MSALVPDTTATVKTRLRELGLAPNHRFGQNFLIDPHALDAIVAAAAPLSAARVLEVGPGLGGLTARLLAAGATVIGVEIDHGLARGLQEAFRGVAGLTLIESDVLAGTRALAPAVLEALAAGGAPPFRIVANLPYGITAPLLLALLDVVPACVGGVVMVQREVGAVLTAGPGDDDYSVLAVAARLFLQVERLMVLGPERFFPQPGVESVVVRFRRVGDLDFSTGAFLDWVRRLFQGRRKTLQKTLRTAHADRAATDIAAALGACDLRPDDRVDGVDPARLARLFLALAPRPPG